MGDMAKLKELVEKGADVNATNQWGLTPLSRAGSSDIAAFLISKGAKPDAKGGAGITALVEAITGGQTDVVKLLIAQGVDVNAKSGGDWTPLHNAVSAGRKDIVELLIAKGADTHAKTKTGDTLLHTAARAGRQRDCGLAHRRGSGCQRALLGGHAAARGGEIPA